MLEKCAFYDFESGASAYSTTSAHTVHLRIENSAYEIKRYEDSSQLSAVSYQPKTGIDVFFWLLRIVPMLAM